MLVEITSDLRYGGKHCARGEVIEVNGPDLALMLSSGRAKPAARVEYPEPSAPLVTQDRMAKVSSKRGRKARGE